MPEPMSLGSIFFLRHKHTLLGNLCDGSPRASPWHGASSATRTSKNRRKSKANLLCGKSLQHSVNREDVNRKDAEAQHNIC